MMEMKEYFDLYRGKESRLSEMRAAKPAIEVLTFEGKVIQQRMLWENDWVVIPTPELVKRSDVLDDGSMI